MCFLIVDNNKVFQTLRDNKVVHPSFNNFDTLHSYKKNWTSLRSEENEKKERNEWKSWKRSVSVPSQNMLAKRTIRKNEEIRRSTRGERSIQIHAKNIALAALAQMASKNTNTANTSSLMIFLLLQQQKQQKGLSELIPSTVTIRNKVDWNPF